MRCARTVQLPKGVFSVKKGRYWYYQERRGRPNPGKRYALPKPGTAEFWARIAEIQSGQDGPAVGSVDALIAAYRGSPKYMRLRPESKKAYEMAIRYISDAWGALPANGLTTPVIQSLLDRLGNKPGTGKMVLAVIRGLYTYGVQRGWHTINPARDAEAPDGDERGADPWPEPVWQAVVAEAPPLLSRLAVLGRATGQRISDLVNMRPKDRDGAGIKTNITKTQMVDHWCPLDQEAIRTIDGWGVFPAAAYLSEKGKPVTPDRARAALKHWVAQRPDMEGLRILPHGLRAMAVCDRRIAGWTHQRIAAAIGMSLPMVMRYSRKIDQRAAASGEREQNEAVQTRGRNLQK